MPSSPSYREAIQGSSSTPDGVVLYSRGITIPGYVTYISETVNIFRKPETYFGNRKYISGIRNIAETVGTPETTGIHGDTFPGSPCRPARVLHSCYYKKNSGGGDPPKPPRRLPTLGNRPGRPPARPSNPPGDPLRSQELDSVAINIKY
jgi:hypothetical protein